MFRNGEIWTLHHEGCLIGRVTIDDVDFPWLEGAFEALGGFEEFRPLFDRSLELVDGDPEVWEVVYAQIADRLELRSPERPVPEFLLNIEGERAWFRWSDTPFD